MPSKRTRKDLSSDEDWAGTESSDDSDDAYDQAQVIVRTADKKKAYVKPRPVSKAQDETDKTENSASKTTSSLTTNHGAEQNVVVAHDDPHQGRVLRKRHAGSTKQTTHNSTETELAEKGKQWGKMLYAAALLAWEDDSTSEESEDDEAHELVSESADKSQKQLLGKNDNSETTEEV
ncbi:hypothetical protein EKO04_001439 [Ascochyta lentis]|uniref:Uncharacterized protein n=1 Tax=Ascochyta lentis TaxID=205686 RepID=A0A8H7MM18_9PLEO|nr:hypothetical protein EKO04_001439 [Ascochyta lentis]